MAITGAGNGIHLGDEVLSGHPQDMALPPAPKPVGPWLVSAAATNTARSGPWGVSFTANPTPDKETGPGKWVDSPTHPGATLPLPQACKAWALAANREKGGRHGEL